MTDTLERPNSARTSHTSPRRYSKHLALWRKSKLTTTTLLKSFPDRCVDEIDAHLKQTAKNLSTPLNVDKTKPGKDTKLVHCHEYCAELAEELANGIGVAIIDRIPSERYTDKENRYLCGLLASLVAPLMAQTHDGVTLYDVRDQKVNDPSKVRKSITNLAQPFHTDGGWHQTPAKLIGLYCIRNALTGGGSHVTSLISAYDSLTAKPGILQTLCTGMPWDKQGEHGPTESPVETLPIFDIADDMFKARFYESYVRGGYARLDQSIPSDLDSALTTLSVTLNQQPRISFDLEPGQFQYLNNWTNVHSREAFDDDPSGATDRYLIRVWNNS